MRATTLLGVDVGTSSTKAVLIDTNGRSIGSATRDHPTFSPAPGFQEQNAEDWWAGVCLTIRQILKNTKVDPAGIAGLSLSGQGCACLPVTRAGEPLGRALIWTDTRATGEQAKIRNIFGTRLGEVTGNDIYDQPEPRMMWIRDHEPQRYQRTFKFLSTVSYLILRFTGQIGANISDWGFHLSFDRTTKTWNEEFLAAVDLAGDKLPRLYAPHEVVGHVTEQAAAATGLISGTPVVAGGQDSTVSALAVGAFSAGQSLNMRGTTDLLCFCTERFDYHPDLYTTCAVLPDLYLSYDMKEVVAAGGSYRWLAKMLFGEALEAHFEAMNELAAAVAAGANGLLYLPYLLISTNSDPALERAGSLFGLTVSTTRAELCRAVLEGTAYALRESADRMARAGITITELRPTGGPTKSPLWNQITADVTGCPVLLPAVSAGAAYGAALLAGLGVGIFPMDDNFETLRRLVKLSGRFDPQPDSRPIYLRTYDVFCQLAGQTAGIAPSLRTAQHP